MNWSDVYARPNRPASPALVTGTDIRKHRVSTCEKTASATTVEATSKPRIPEPRHASIKASPIKRQVHVAAHRRVDSASLTDNITGNVRALVSTNPYAVVAAVALAIVMIAFISTEATMPVPEKKAFDIPVQVSESVEVDVPVFDSDVPYVKSADASRLQFAQSGEPWSDLPYWGDNVALNGCGLCSYTSVIDILTGENYTPIDMLDIRGDWEGMDNYPDDDTGLDGITHAQFTLNTFGIEEKRIDVNLNTLAAAAARGDTVAIVCAGGDDFLGTMRDEHSYPGHFVCVWDFDGENFHVHDSATSHGYGCDVIYTPADMQELLDGTTSIVAYRKLV